MRWPVSMIDFYTNKIFEVPHNVFCTSSGNQEYNFCFNSLNSLRNVLPNWDAIWTSSITIMVLRADLFVSKRIFIIGMPLDKRLGTTSTRKCPWVWWIGKLSNKIWKITEDLWLHVYPRRQEKSWSSISSYRSTAKRHIVRSITYHRYVFVTNKFHFISFGS